VAVHAVATARRAQSSCRACRLMHRLAVLYQQLCPTVCYALKRLASSPASSLEIFLKLTVCVGVGTRRSIQAGLYTFLLRFQRIDAQFYQANQRIWLYTVSALQLGR
jgi:hypothetical protein